MESVGTHSRSLPVFEALEPRLLLSGNVLITEFMASNGATLLDGDGESSDWIEIHNPTDAPVTLDGWYLTDKSGNLDKWRFPDATPDPDITIAPGGYMVVFASGQDDEDYPYHDGTYYHTNFSLSKEDESVLLVRPDGVTIEHGYEDYPEQFTDISYGIYLDSDPWDTLVGEGAKLSYLVPTAGDAGLLPTGEDEGEQGWTAVDFDDSEWTDAMVFGPADIVITEISTDGTKFVEIQNASISSVNNPDLTVLVNNGSVGINSVNAMQWQLPDSIAPGEILYKTDSAGDNYWGAPIYWTAAGPGWAMVVDEGGAEVEVMDFVVWGYTEAEIALLDISYGGDDHITVGGQWSGNGVDITGGGVPGPVENAIEFGSTWNYLHPLNATDPAVSDPDFNSTWMQPTGYDGPVFSASGPAILGYGGIGMGGVATHIGQPDPGKRYTAYFRSEFTLTDNMENVGIELLSDDGGVIYIDGVEVARNNFSLPKQDTYFIFTNGVGNENGTATLSISDLGAGTHTIAASIHQTSATSSDIGFDLRLFGQPVSGGGLVRRAGSSDGDTASDFQANSESTKGMENPGITVPFGVVTDTTTGIGFSDNQQAFEDIIATDVGEGKMLGVNPSLWTRIEFTGSEELSGMETLALSMMYDDGFVAYLNGVQVAQRNEPVTLAWNSSAAAVHPDSEAVVYEEIDLTPHLGLLREGANVLAIHGLNFGVSDSDFLISPKLIATRSEPMRQHFAEATPGQTNTEEWWRYVEDTSFDHDRGFYTEPFNLVISSDTAGAQIYYTTNGTSPLLSDGSIHADATLYTAPISITTTTVVRAVAVKPSYAPTNTDTHTYIFLEDVLQQPANPDGFPPDWKGTLANYAMDSRVVNHATYGATIMDDMRAVPTISIVTSVEDMFGVTGIYSNPRSQGADWEKPASVEWINTDGSTLFQVDAGVQIVGGASRSEATKKHSFRLVFKGMYGPTTLDYPIFDDTDVDEFNTITLRAGFNDRISSTLLQDRWAAERQLAAGGLGGHGSFAHLYVDGLYWGLYNPVERPDDAFAANYLGGDKDDYDAYNIEGLNAGTSAAWNLLHSLANNAVANYAAIEGMLDMTAFCDYLIVNQYGGNWDWPQNNWWATYNREDDGKWRFHSWDAEGCLRGINDNRVEQTGSALGSLYSKLRIVPEFKQLFADRVHKHMYNDGVLTLEANVAWLDAAEAAIFEAVVGESARWGDGYGDNEGLQLRDENWVPRIAWRRDTYFPARSDVTSTQASSMIKQWRDADLYPDVDAPSFDINGSYQHGGIMDLGGELTIEAPLGAIYYTLDGSDPDSGGILYSGAIALAQGGHVKSRVQYNGEWSALNEATFYIDVSADIRVTEVMYNPAPPTPDEFDSGYTDADDFEYIEITNISDHTLPLTGLRFDNGIDFTFGAISIDPGEYVVVVSNLAAFDERYDVAGNGISVAGEYGTGLISGTQFANAGENVELAAPIGGNIQDFSYGDGWYSHTDGEGFSLTIRNPRGPSDRWDDKDGWRSSAAPGGSPGYGDTLTDPGSVIIHEVLAHTDEPQVDAIELRNTTSSPIDVSGWWLSDRKTDEFGVEVLNKYQIPAGSVIETKGYLVLNATDHFGAEFLLSEHGDNVYLSSDASGVAGGYREHVDFDGSPNGVSLGVYTKSTGGTDFTLLRTPFLGFANGVPYFEDLVINEVMYHPPNPTRGEINEGYINDADFEFIEIYNKSDTVTHTLSDFYIGGGVGFSFGWYDADAADGSNMWTLEAGATATWTTTGLDTAGYQVFARWDRSYGDDGVRDLDELAKYSITHSGGSSSEVLLDQNVNESGWVLLGEYNFTGAGQVVLTRGTNDPDNWTIADEIKFVRTGHEVVVSDPTLDSWYTDNPDVPTTLGPGEYAVIVSNRDAFDYRYNYPAIVGQNDIVIAGQYTGTLSDSGEKVKLMRAGGVEDDFTPYYRIDYVNYGDSSPWPDAPDGDGPSLSRNDPYGPHIPFPYGNDPSSWFAGEMNGSPGAANSPADMTPPAVPQNVNAQADAIYTQVELDWSASEDLDTCVDHYVIYRDGGKIGTSESLTYIDTSVQLLTPYSYEVAAVNRDGLKSDRSTAVGIAIGGIVSHSTPANTQISLLFSEPLVESSAKNLSNYTLIGGTLSGAILEADGVTVTLTTTAALVSGSGYTLTIGALTTVSGTFMPAGQQASFRYDQEIEGTTPTVASSIGDINVSEDADDMVVDLAPVFHDPDVGDSLRFMLVTNTNSSLVQASIAADKLHLSFLDNRNGAADITVLAVDLSGAWAENTFTVNVAAISDDDSPVVDHEISDFTVVEDSANTVLNLAGVFYDPDTSVKNDDVLTLSTVSGGPGLVTAVIDGNELILSCVGDQNGAADITVRATDSDSHWVEDTFTVTISPVNDAPIVASEFTDIDVVESATPAPAVLNLAAAFDDADIALNADSLAFAVTGNTNDGLVDTTTSPGTLFFTPNEHGVAEITIRATDLAGDWVEDTFIVAVTPSGSATVDNILVSSSGWSESFLDYLDDEGLGHSSLSHLGYSIPTDGDQLKSLPWTGLNTLAIAFSKPVAVAQNDMVLYGIKLDESSTSTSGAGFVYDAPTFTATWTFDGSIEPGKLSIALSAGGYSGADFPFRFNVLTGDTNQDGETVPADGAAVRNNTFVSTDDAGYSELYDLNGSGRIDFFDWVIVMTNLGELPAGEPTVPPGAPSGGAFAAVGGGGAPLAVNAPVAPALGADVDILAEFLMSDEDDEIVKVDIPLEGAAPILVYIDAVGLPSPGRQPAPVSVLDEQATPGALMGEDISAPGADFAEPLDTDDLLVDVLADAEFDAFSLGR
ncbi:MAG: lamin tail domain-containing protein [Phycisphaerae bacterium]|nr:lamin tail domain-containing protein [Phycisphaerae bacterium]